ncbi:MAG: hypothetical protein J6R67_09915 [Treponema sp.]|nr:hypothetical protein [Treponema sp.]
MNDVLSGIERDLVISYLCDCNVPFSLIQNQNLDRIFSFVTGQGGVRILPEGIILFSDADVLPQEIIGTQVTLRFYFKKLGLSFSSLVSCTKSGALALVVPREILRIADLEENTGTGFSCNVFLGEAFSGQRLVCSLRDGYPLFMPWMWRCLPENPDSQLSGRLRGLCGATPVDTPSLIRDKLVATGKALLVTAGWVQPGMILPFDGCITSRDMVGELELLDSLAQLKSGFYFACGHQENNRNSQAQVYCIEGISSSEDLVKILPLIPVCRYLAEPQDNFPPPALLDRMQPLELLYLSSAEIIFATQKGLFPLQQEVRYSLLLQIPFNTLRRTITVDCFVSTIFEGDDGRTCALCRLENLKAEDQRFLFESLNNSRFL